MKIILLILLLLLVISGIAIVVSDSSGVATSIYNVWQQGLAGKATLERAEQERQILVKQALAERDSATWLWNNPFDADCSDLSGQTLVDESDDTLPAVPIGE